MSDLNLFIFSVSCVDLRLFAFLKNCRSRNSDAPKNNFIGGHRKKIRSTFFFRL
jgi:hypothetical protein